MNLFKKNLLRLGSLICHNNASKIIFYHDISGENRYTDMATSMNMFRLHLKAIDEAGFQSVTQISKRDGQIKICFDDGFEGLWDNREVIFEQNWRPTVFIAVDLIGQRGYLSREQILELQKQGFEFQGHSWSHQILTQFHGEGLDHEIIDSKNQLSEMIGREITEICFPVGHFSDEVLDCCRKAGYKKMYSSIPGNYDDEVFSDVLRRNLVQFYDVSEFRNVLYGALNLFDRHYINIHYSGK